MTPLQSCDGTEITRVIRFLFVGIVNTGFSYACFVVLLWVGVNLAMSVALSTVAGVVFNFFSFGTFVFGSARGRSFIFFILLYASIAALNYLMLRGLAALAIRAEIAQIFCLPVMAVLSYLGMRFWVYAPAKTAKGITEHRRSLPGGTRGDQTP